MDTQLTTEQLAAIAVDPRAAVPAGQDADGETYFVIRESTLRHLEGLAEQQDELSHRRLRELISEGVTAPHVDADQAETHLRAYAERVASETE